ncbi:MAG TPA: preprotein translocase subunit SecE [Solirubrobacteraceae bacterium]|nr:preprotein translocase subunit SecE [Solirubrobacteraceae bacterium]
MARDRQRAKQRKARREKSGRPDAAPHAETPQQEQEPQHEHDERNPLVREDLSGQLEHMTANVDQFDAALVAGAEGVTVPEDTELGDGVVHPEELDDEDFEELEDRIDEVEQAIETGDQEHVGELEHELDEEITTRRRTRAAAPAPTPATATRKGPGRFFAFLRASWAELRRVQWPDRRQVGQATAVVLGFVLVAGVYLGIADALAKKLVDLII